jgi:hypothetical protein
MFRPGARPSIGPNPPVSSIRDIQLTMQEDNLAERMYMDGFGGVGGGGNCLGPPCEIVVVVTSCSVLVVTAPSVELALLLVPRFTGLIVLEPLKDCYCCHCLRRRKRMMSDIYYW